MKKFKCFLPAIIAISFLTGCSHGMKYWPYCDLPDEILQYQNISIEISKNRSYPESDNITTTKYVGTTENAVVRIYNMIEHLNVSPKPVDIEFPSYIDKVFIVFSSDNSEYVFEFYGFGIKDGYFVFNHESTHIYPGDFVGLIIGVIEDLSNNLIKV